MTQSKLQVLLQSMMLVVMRNAEATMELAERLDQSDIARELQESVRLAGMELELFGGTDT